MLNEFLKQNIQWLVEAEDFKNLNITIDNNCCILKTDSYTCTYTITYIYDNIITIQAKYVYSFDLDDFETFYFEVDADDYKILDNY